jgi:predicted hydrolase (HD superfamily)
MGQEETMEKGPLHLGRETFGRPEDRGRLPTRDEAEALLNEWVTNDRLKLHMRQLAALMEAWARDKLGLPKDQVELWALTGLLHDADWDKWPDRHGQIIIAWLEERHYDPDLIHGIAAHGWHHFGVTPVSDLDKMIFAFDELSGFVHAVSLVRPEGYNGMEVSSLKKKLKQASFAAQVNRQDITDGLELTGLSLDDLCAFVIQVQQHVR